MIKHPVEVVKMIMSQLLKGRYIPFQMLVFLIQILCDNEKSTNCWKLSVFIPDQIELLLGHMQCLSKNPNNLYDVDSVNRWCEENFT